MRWSMQRHLNGVIRLGRRRRGAVSDSSSIPLFSEPWEAPRCLSVEPYHPSSNSSRLLYDEPR